MILYRISDGKPIAIGDYQHQSNGDVAEVVATAEARARWDEIEKIVPNPMPDYDTATHRVETSWKVIKNTYAQTWQKILLSDWDKWAKAWHDQSYVKRIKAPVTLLQQQLGIAVWMQINNLPVIVEGGTIYLYMNVILPDHRKLAADMGEVIEIQHLYPYLLNIASKEIHAMNDKSGACNIDQIANKKWLKDDNEMRAALTEGADGCGHCMPEYNNNEGGHHDSGFSEQYPSIE